MRPLLDQLPPAATDGDLPDPEALNALLSQLPSRPVTGSGCEIRFVAESAAQGPYELQVFHTGCVPTRRGNWHDFFNALAWMTYPRTKAKLNAMHATLIPTENPRRRSRLRDLATLIDEGGAVVAISDPGLEALVRAYRWIDLFWLQRETLRRRMRIMVLGHALLDMSRNPWPGLTPKVMFMLLPADLPGDLPDEAALAGGADAHAAAFLAALPPEATPRDLPPMPVFGYPDWFPGSSTRAFFEDTRYFRPLRKPASTDGNTSAAPTMHAGVGQTAAVTSVSEQRKVRAPQSRMQGNALARRRDE